MTALEQAAPADESTPESFDLGWAEVQLERIADIQRAFEQNETTFKRLKLRHENIQAPLKAELARREELVRLFAEAHRKQLLVGKAKSRALHAGRVGWRATPEKLEVQNEALLLDWAKEHHFTEEVPDMEAIRRYVKETGEVPPGTDLKEPEERFYAKPAGAAEEGE